MEGGTFRNSGCVIVPLPYYKSIKHGLYFMHNQACCTVFFSKGKFTGDNLAVLPEISTYFML